MNTGGASENHNEKPVKNIQGSYFSLRFTLSLFVGLRAWQFGKQHYFIITKIRWAKSPWRSARMLRDFTA